MRDYTLLKKKVLFYSNIDILHIIIVYYCIKSKTLGRIILKNNSSGHTLLGVDFSNNKEQCELIRLINENDKHIIFCEGAAGTGKNFASVAAAYQLILDKKFKNIIYTRNPIQLGEGMGFLKGDAEEKNEPFMQPLRDTVESLVHHSSERQSLNVNTILEKIQVIPLAFMRGKNIDDSVCIFDEAQNCSISTLNAVLTRGTQYSKIIVLGSIRQIDDFKLRREPVCDFQRVIDALRNLPYVGYQQLFSSMRSPWCAEVDEILSDLEKNKLKSNLR